MTLSSLNTNKLLPARVSPWASVTATTGSPTTGTYFDGSSTWAYYKFTASGTITVTSGLIDLLVCAPGGGSSATAVWYAGGGGGEVRWGAFPVSAGTITVTVPAGAAAGGSGSTASFGSVLLAMGGQAGYANGVSNALTRDGYSSSGGIASGGGAATQYGGGAGGSAYGVNNSAGVTLAYDNNTSTEYGAARRDGNAGTANRGEGAGAGNLAGGSGVVIARVRTDF